MPLFTTYEFNSLEDLLLNQLEDLYDAENRLVKALPRMADAATAPLCGELSNPISKKPSTRWNG